MQLTKIKWEDALNVASSAENKTEGEWQVQRIAQLNKLNLRYWKTFCVRPNSIDLKINSGANYHFHKISSTNLPQQPNSNYNPAEWVVVPSRASMVSSTTTHIPIPSLPPSATKSHGFNNIASESIFLSEKPAIIILVQFWQKFYKNLEVYRGQY